MSREEIIMRNRDQLVRKRGAIKARLTSYKNLLNEIEETHDMHKLKAHLERLEVTFNKLEEYTEKLHEIEPDKDHYTEQEAMEEEYTNLRAKSYKLQDRVAEIVTTAQSAANNRISPHPFSSQSNLIRLPEQALPKFSGKYEEWLSFQDDFQSTIGQRSGLSETEKLKYLRSCLTGEPERLVKQFETTDEGYRSEKKVLLKKMFEDKGRIRERHVIEIFNIPPMQRESAHELSDLINTVELHRSALKSLSEDTFSTMMLCIVLSKIDKTTKKHWKMSLSEGQLPNYENLIAFLRRMVISSDEPSISFKDDRAHAQLKNRNGTHSTQNSKATRLSRSFVTTADKGCPICKNQHNLLQCQEFKGLSPKERFQVVSRISLCINCLHPGHSVRKCTSTFTCKTCLKRHHTWLHFPEQLPPATDNSKTSKVIQTQA